MNKFRKAISVGMSAALLASLFTVIAAPAAFAAAGSTSVTGPVSIGPGATSATEITINFTEGTSAAPDFQYPATGFTATIQLYDKSLGSQVGFSGTPVLSGGPGSLVKTTGFPQLATSGVVGGVANDQLKLSFDSTDTTGSEPFTITGLKIKASSTAAAGAIVMRVTAVTGLANVSAWGNGNLTVSATTSGAVAAGAFVVPTAGNTGPFAFGVSGSIPGGVNGIAGSNGLLVIDDGASTESVGVVAAGSAFGPPTTAIGTNPLSFGHASGTGVSQNVVVAGLLASPGAIVNGLVVNTTNSSANPTAVQPGENNQPIGGIDVFENAAGTLAVGTVITFTLDTPGVKFSSSPVLHLDFNNLNLGSGAGANTPCSLSFDRTSCSVTVTAKSTIAPVGAPVIILGSTEVSAALVDLDASVPQGTTIGINVTTSPSLPVRVVDNAVAMVSRVIIGVGATPTIYINENDQQSGLLTLTESVAGQFKDASDDPGQNWFGLCQLTGESYTRAPWAVVTAGDLKLRSGAAAATSVIGQLFSGPGSVSCVKWQVWSKSTVASTIELRGSDAAGVVLPSGANNGPRLSVPAGLTPGSTLTQVNVGTETQVNANSVKQTIATNAVRAFRNQPVVAAVSQPTIPVGTTDSVLGNITITETQAGQFKAGEVVTVTIQPVVAPGIQSVVLLNTSTTSKMPVVSTNSASGLLTSAVTINGTTSFSFSVAQQATGTLGVITISNIHVFTVTGATPGPILVRVTAPGIASVGPPVVMNPGVAIDQVVSPGKLGAVSVAEATINAGLNTRTGFGFATESVARGAYVTIRSRASGSAPGDLVQVWVKTKTTAWKLESSRRVSPNGFMYYSGKVLNSGYRYYRVLYVTQGSISNTVRAYGR